MNTGRQVFEGLGIDPDNYLCLNFATTGIYSPIGVLEIAGRFGEESDRFSYFVEPSDMMIPSDLNYPYTKIDRHVYDRNKVDTSVVLNDFLPYLREKAVSILLINSPYWFGKLRKERVNSGLFPLFSVLNTLPMFPISSYETARLAHDYTIFDKPFEAYYEMFNHMERLRKQAPADYRCNVDDGYSLRGGEEGFDDTMTASAVSVEKMVYIWNDILRNNEASEVLNREEVLGDA